MRARHRGCHHVPFWESMISRADCQIYSLLSLSCHISVYMCHCKESISCYEKYLYSNSETKNLSWVMYILLYSPEAVVQELFFKLKTSFVQSNIAVVFFRMSLFVEQLNHLYL